ncbi:MAG: transglycosylase SLT domain-containing protein [Bacteroidota bacterium]
MKTSLLKYTLLLAILCNVGALKAQYQTANTDQSVPLYTDEDIRMRLRNIASCVIPRYTDVVKSYIRTYTIKNRDKTERMLGKTVMYFPIYEKYANEYGLPEALKYLSITESALDPVAVSSAKAVGLWQFMKLTGKEYGLRIDDVIDERCDPHLSTDAAMRYLKRQYKRFGNWPLAIAAYNSGGGNVSRAVRRGRSTNFWKIRKYLPRETRNYVPAYIAAAYLMQHYEKHNLNPSYPEMDLQLTDVTKVYESLDFNQIAAITGLSITTIRALNPSYKRDYIPMSTKGRYLILPKRVMNDFNSHFVRLDQRQVNQRPRTRRKNTGQPLYTKSYYTVQQGDNLPFLAKLFNCETYHLKVWNDLKTDEIKPGQELLLFAPYYEDNAIRLAEDAPTVASPFVKIPSIQPKPVTPLKGFSVLQKKAQPETVEYLYHTIQRNESLKSISAKYRIPIPVLLKINEIDEDKLPKPGNIIRVKVIQ